MTFKLSSYRKQLSEYLNFGDATVLKLVHNLQNTTNYVVHYRNLISNIFTIGRSVAWSWARSTECWWMYLNILPLYYFKFGRYSLCVITQYSSIVYSVLHFSFFGEEIDAWKDETHATPFQKFIVLWSTMCSIMYLKNNKPVKKKRIKGIKSR